MNSMPRLFACLCVVLFLCAPMVAQAQESIADETNDNAPNEGEGLRLPRFVSLRVDEVNARVGPGKQYAIRWVYRRSGLPVEVVEQYEHWRKIRDVDGDTGWVHKSMLSPKRTALVRDDTRLMMREAAMGSGIVLRAEAGVIAQLIACEANWCRMQIESRKGWLPKNQFFGAYADEIFQ